jgi:hypothetical protein
MIRDDKSNPAAVRIENATMRSSDEVMIEMSNGGGFVARFSKG